MKTYNDLYLQICDFKNLYNAFLKARRNKRYRPEVLRFNASLEENLISIQTELIWKTYQTGRYRSFYVYEPKQRLIMALPFRDRIVHHALCNIIEPIFDRTFIFDSYACRHGKGTHAGADRLTSFLRRAHRIWPKVYCLKADIRQYFPSVTHSILCALIERKIQCGDTLQLIFEIINSTADPDDPNTVGIPIGNLTSQLAANIYLNELDRFVKHDLRMKFYIRYLDDFVVLLDDKKALWRVRQEIEGFLWSRLRLRFNSKTDIFPASRGADFLGYRIWPTHRLLRKSSTRRMRKKLKSFEKRWWDGTVTLDEIRQSIASWIGHTRHCNAYFLRRELFNHFRLVKSWRQS
jgi:retron-type reverse transcriptase